MKEKGYITIQGWMRKDLGLSGNELLAYALIYGFSQDGESTFRGSLAYVAEWLGCSKPTAIYTLKKLVEKKLVERIEEPINGILFVRYRTLTSSKETLQGELKNLTTPSKETLPNNTNNINLEDNKKENKEKKGNIPTVEEIREFCLSRNNGVDPQKVYDYYASANWKDGRGNPVKNWKQKIIAVWEKSTEKKQGCHVAHKSDEYNTSFNEDGTFIW